MVEVKADALKNYISSLDHCTETPQFSDFDEAFQQLKADLLKAKKEILVSVPNIGAFSEKNHGYFYTYPPPVQISLFISELTALQDLLKSIIIFTEQIFSSVPYRTDWQI